MVGKDVIYLVDGSSYIHRAYHAIRDLTNSKGFPTNAIYGVLRMLIKLLKEKAPRYVSVVFDSKGPNFRHQIYPEYKANRPPLPESLVVQIPIIKELVAALGLHSLEMEGYEADDLIGSLARAFEREGYHVVVVSGDKDLKQLLSPNISMWDPMKDQQIDYETIKRELNLEPGQLVDVMALSGDSIDNIPGVPGIGEKTALKLIQEFGSLEKLFSSIEEIKTTKLRERLTQNKEMALLSRRLVKIKDDLQLSLSPPSLGKRDERELSRLLRELEFASLWRELGKEETPEAHYKTVTTLMELKGLKEEILKQGLFSFDIETTNENPILAEMVGISICLREGNSYYIPLGHAGPVNPFDLNTFKAEFKDIFEDGSIRKIGHNIKYDSEVLINNGIDIKGIYFDTMIASYLVNPEQRQHNLAFLAQHYLNFKKTLYEDLVGKGKDQKNLAELPVDIVSKYCCEDSDFTFRLYNLLYKELEQSNNLELFFEVEIPLVYILIEMELNGIAIDVNLFNQMSFEFQKRIDTLAEEIYKEVGMEFNINSPQQLSYVLFEKLKLPALKKTAKTKAFSTNVKVLKELASGPHRLPKLLLEYRTLAKLKSTYLDTLVNLVNPKTGRLHTSFNQTVTATGRLSSSNPNLQNIPVRGEEGREIRKGFVAPEGSVLLSADYSQIELRIFAHYSQDPKLIEAFLKEEDIHNRTAMEIFGLKEPSMVSPDMRRMAKAINFGIIYGMGPQKLSDELGIDLKLARSYIEAYYERYPGVLSYRKEMVERAKRNGYVTTLFNRRRYLPNIYSENKGLAAEAERAAINTPIQGTAADLIKKAMVNLKERLRRENLKAKFLLQVHDELLFEVPSHELDKTIMTVKEEMEGVYDLRVPLKVDVGYGKNWDEAHP